MDIPGEKRQKYLQGDASGEERQKDEQQASFWRRPGAAGWSAIAGMIGAIAAVLALFMPGGGDDPSPSPTTAPSPEDTIVDQVDAERVAAEEATDRVEEFGIFIPAGQFSSSCSLVSTSVANEVWDCSVSHSQCSGTVILTFTESGLANVKNNVFCKE
jgi:hypothetical protein